MDKETIHESSGYPKMLYIGPTTVHCPMIKVMNAKLPVLMFNQFLFML